MNKIAVLTKENLFRIISCIIIFLLFTPSDKIKFALPFFIILALLFKEKTHIFLHLKESIKKYFFIKILAILFVYQFLNYIFALVSKRADLLTFPLFILTFWLPMTFLLLVNKRNYSFIKKWLKIIIIFQIVIVIFRCIVTGCFFPNDFVRGFTSSAHWLGLCMIWLLFVCIVRRRNSILNSLTIIFSSFVLYLTDAKAIIVITMLILPILIVILILKKYPPFFYLKIFLYYILLGSILFSGVYMLKVERILKAERKVEQIPRVENKIGQISKSEEVSKIEKAEKIKELFKKIPKDIDSDYNANKLRSIYIDGIMNHKLLFIKRGFQYLLRNNLILVGTSPGTLGSRASNVRARDTLYKPDGPKLSFLTIYSSPATKEVYHNLYFKAYHKSAAFVINTLALPFSSVFSFCFENGLIGLIILLICIFSVVRTFLRSNSPIALEGILIMLIVILWGLFDTIWERPFVMGLLYLILSANFYQQKN